MIKVMIMIMNFFCGSPEVTVHNHSVPLSPAKFAKHHPVPKRQSVLSGGTTKSSILGWDVHGFSTKFPPVIKHGNGKYTI